MIISEWADAMCLALFIFKINTQGHERKRWKACDKCKFGRNGQFKSGC